MRRRRPILEAERLEARLQPDVSPWHAAAPPVHLFAGREDIAGASTDLIRPPLFPAFVALPGTEAAAAADEAAPALPGRGSEDFFARPEELASLFTADTDGEVQAALSLLEELPDQVPPEATVAGWEFLRGYVSKAIRNNVRRYGPLADPEDLVHQVFVEWWEQVGAEDRALGGLPDRDSAELQVLRRVIPRVLSRARYEHGKQAQRVENVGPARVEAHDWAELQMDLEAGVGSLDGRERQVLELRRQGKTFDEIGPELGMSKQWASDVFQAVVGRLQQLYAGAAE